MNKRTTLLMLSGGLDSTTCLFKLLTETDDDVHTCYVDLKNNKDKVWCEKQALHSIKPIAQEVRKFTHHEGSSFDIMGHAQGVQPLLWMLASVFMLNEIVGTRKRLCIGYTRGDSAIAEIENIKDHWGYIWDWLGNGRCPAFYMPLAKRTKAQSMDYLRRLEYERSIEIVKHLWTCEGLVRAHGPNSSGFVACKKCLPCKRGLEIGLVQP
jgi:hypothetical protein